MLDSELAEEMSCPPSFICPITQVIMQDPYIDPDGNSYEKDAIMDWLKTSSVSPITRNALSTGQLTPNRVLRSLIEDFRAGKFPFGSSTNGETGSPSSNAKALTEQTAAGRKPVFLIAVIDTSGSMQLSCGKTGSDDSQKGEGEFSRLDLVKHTLNTIISSLGELDQICIIKFSTNAEIFARPSTLNESNKAVLLERVKHLQPEAQTNLWAGIRSALDVACSIPAETASSINTEIFVLTDGEPNINPPRPIEETVQRYLQRSAFNPIKECMPRVHTFGYGYNLKSEMLFKISQIGGGCFGFIPDASMVGTVFINALSSSLCTASTSVDAPLHLSTSVQQVCQEFSTTLAAIMLEATSSKERTQRLTGFVNHLEALQKCLQESEGSNTSTPPPTTTTSTTAAAPKKSVFSFLSGTGNAAKTSAIDNLPNDASGATELKDFIAALLVDCRPSAEASDGQVSKAIQVEFFEKWGQHYLWSVLSAFNTMKCINFKDKAMQAFKSVVFSAEQERVEEIFLDIKPPVPSIPAQSTTAYAGRRGGGAIAAAAAAPVNMRSYYNTCGGCFTADSLIVAARYSTTAGCVKDAIVDINHIDDKETQQCARVVRADELRSGVVVLTDKGWSTVERVVLLRYRGPLFAVHNMTLTEYHPVLLPASSQHSHNQQQAVAYFPGECGQKSTQDFDGFVYDLVLSNRGLIASPVDSASPSPGPAQLMFAATFGHSCKLDKFSHEYFGSESVVDDITRIAAAAAAARSSEKSNKENNRTLDEGVVVLMNYQFKRDAVTKRVIGIECFDCYNANDGSGNATELWSTSASGIIESAPIPPLPVLVA